MTKIPKYAAKRKISGKVFLEVGCYYTYDIAEDIAEEFRKRGYYARILSASYEHIMRPCVYVRKRKK